MLQQCARGKDAPVHGGHVTPLASPQKLRRTLCLSAWLIIHGTGMEDRLAYVAAKALDALAGLLEFFVGSRIRHAKKRAHGKGGAMHDGDTLLVQ